MNDLLTAPSTVTTKPLLMLKVSDVAANCGVSPKTVYRWINNDELPVHRLPGSGSRGITLISPADLEAWLRRHRVDPSLCDQQVIKLEGRRYFKSNAGNRPKQA